MRERDRQREFERGRVARGASGEATQPSRRVRSCATNRSAVLWSKRSAAYSRLPNRPPVAASIGADSVGESPVAAILMVKPDVAGVPVGE